MTLSASARPFAPNVATKTEDSIRNLSDTPERTAKLWRNWVRILDGPFEGQTALIRVFAGNNCWILLGDGSEPFISIDTMAEYLDQ
jgi:hypothetical protein